MLSKKWGDASPCRKKVGGRRPPASPPHYTPEMHRMTPARLHYAAAARAMCARSFSAAFAKCLWPFAEVKYDENRQLRRPSGYLLQLMHNKTWSSCRPRQSALRTNHCRQMSADNMPVHSYHLNHGSSLSVEFRRAQSLAPQSYSSCIQLISLH